MFKEIIEHINERLENVPYFTVNYGFSELKTNGNNQKQPVYYSGGKLTVVKFNKLGISYIRKNGNTSTSRATNGNKACDPLLSMVTPITIFALTKRELFTEQDAFVADKVVESIIKEVAFEGGQFKREISAQSLSVIPTGYSTDSEAILLQENPGSGRNDFNQFDVVVSVQFNISVTAYHSCLANVCTYGNYE